jgi:hypothetical protein
MVAVEPEIVNSKDPTDVTTTGSAVETLEFDTSWIDCDARVLTSVTRVGVMIPSAPVDTTMYTLVETVKLPLPDDTVGYTQSDPLGCEPYPPLSPV